MALASIGTVILGTFGFLIFWTLATFPAFPGLPIGRTAGAVLGAALMVVFQVDSPDDAYAAIDLPILGLLFGTMVVSVYLERAHMFEYLAHALSWKCRGGKDLLCRVCFLVAFSSAIFTNDTCCVVFTEFLIKLCVEKNLPLEPFLLALASSANLGSSATPIGNPQNLVIAIMSKISFGKFLIGILPAMVVGVTLNTAFLLLMYWKQLSKVELGERQKDSDLFEVTIDQVRPLPLDSKINIDETEDFYSRPSLASGGKSQAFDSEHPEDTRKKHTSYTTPEGARADLIRNLSGLNLDRVLEGSLHGQGNKNPLKEHTGAIRDHPEDTKRIYTSYSFSEGTRADLIRSLSGLSLDRVLQGNLYGQGNKNPPEEHTGSIQVLRVSVGSRSDREIHSLSPVRSAAGCESPPPFSEEKESASHKRKRMMWTICVYLIAVAMLAALLSGLNLSWCTIAAAVALMALDFTDAGPCIDKVSYSLLVFFSGMFITIDGFNKTGIPGALWNAMEPHARINHASGVVVLVVVIIVLSNVASNVPTVLLLGARVAASAAASHGASETKAWLILAWASTIAGNLTLVGSAANLIVCEKARTAPNNEYHLSFWRHLRFGFPATLFIVAVGIPMIQG